MRKNKFYTIGIATLIAMAPTVFFTSCQKEDVAQAAAPVPDGPAPLSFTEDFNDVSKLSARGWAFRNNSSPVGPQGWRVGRYETLIAPSNKPNLPAIVGFPAYNATKSPNDFVSCDVAAVNTNGDISAWLITPPMTIKNGDVLTFYTRAMDDTQFPIYTIDRMQVRGNFTDGTANVGTSSTSVGSFTTLLLDINPGMVENDLGGYPYTEWEEFSITFSGITGTVKNARLAFRYFMPDSGIEGGSSGARYASLIGIDNLVFESK
jgi:hypothetical protein